MPNQITQALEALKDAIREAISAAESVGHPQSGGSAFRRAKEAEEAVWTAIAALSSAAPSAAEPVAFDLTQARSIVVDAIRRMRAAHVDCHDLTMLAEDFLQSTHAAAKSDSLWDQTLQDRDNYHEWADQLASRIATITGTDIGEHSSANNPWSNAINAADYYLAAPPAQQAASEPVAGLSGDAEREALTETLLQGMCDAIEQDLLSYRCTNIVDADDGQHGFPLTDLLTLPGDKDIKRGQDEIHMIVDSIYHAIKPLLSAALHSTGKPDGEMATVTLPRHLVARMLLLEVNELHRLIDNALAAPSATSAEPTVMDEKGERELFEKWAKAHLSLTNENFKREEDGTYSYVKAWTGWKVWRALRTPTFQRLDERSGLDLFAEASTWSRRTGNGITQETADLLGWLTGAVQCHIERIASQADAPVAEPVAWPNGCDRTVPEALRYLSKNPRPVGGEQEFNAAHLLQLAGEIQRMAQRPLYTRPPAPEEGKDAARLDWLDETNLRRKMGWKVGRAPAGSVSIMSVIFLGDEGPTPIREAIDAAMAQGEPR